MSDPRRIATFLAAGFVGTALVIAAAGPAWSQPPVDVIAKPASQVRYVPHGDLSLATKEGQRTLYRRVGLAVREVCPMVEDEGSWYDVSGCVAFAWHGARPQIRRAFDEARSGSSLAMSSSITVAVGK